MMFSSSSDPHNSNTVLINSCPSSLISTSLSHEDVVGLAQVWVGCWHGDKNTRIKPVLQDVSRSVVKSCPQSIWSRSLLQGSCDCTREALKAVSSRLSLWRSFIEGQGWGALDLHLRFCHPSCTPHPTAHDSLSVWESPSIQLWGNYHPCRGETLWWCSCFGVTHSPINNPLHMQVSPSNSLVR